MSATWFEAVAIDAFPEDGKLATKLGEWNVLIVREDGAFTAFNDCCTHQASALSTGRIRRGTIMCPLHGARFEARTGKCIGGAKARLRPATPPPILHSWPAASQPVGSAGQ